MSGPVKAALLGVGGYGQKLLEASRHVDDLEIVEAYYYRPERAAEVEAKLGIPVVTDLDRVLEDPEIQALVIVTPNDQHLPQAKAGLLHGKAVFVDKPITNTVEEARELIRVEKETGGLLMVGHNFRRLRAFRACQKAISEGKIGDLVSVEGNFSRDGAYEVTPSSWRARDRCPTGPLIQLGIHVVDIELLYFGRPKQVFGYVEQVLPEGANVDNTAGLIHFEGPRLGYIGSNYLGPFRASLAVYGTEGNLYADGVQARFLSRSGREEVLYQGKNGLGAEMDASHVEQLEEFARLVREGGRPETDSYGALQALAVVNAVEISAREKRPVDVDQLLEGVDA